MYWAPLLELPERGEDRLPSQPLSKIGAEEGSVIILAAVDRL